MTNLYGHATGKTYWYVEERYTVQDTRFGTSWATLAAFPTEAEAKAWAEKEGLPTSQIRIVEDVDR